MRQLGLPGRAVQRFVGSCLRFLILAPSFLFFAIDARRTLSDGKTYRNNDTCHIAGMLAKKTNFEKKMGA